MVPYGGDGADQCISYSMSLNEDLVYVAFVTALAADSDVRTVNGPVKLIDGPALLIEAK